MDSKVFEKDYAKTNSKAAWDKLGKNYGGDAKVKKVKVEIFENVT